MFLVDTHCHLDDKSYQQDLDAVVQRAIEAGIQRLVVPGVNLHSSREAIQLTEKYPEIYAAVGISPSDVNTFSREQINEFSSLAKAPKVVAIGEIGLDFYHRKDNSNEQILVLEHMLEIAIQTDLPLILHSRQSFETLLPIIMKWKEENPSHGCRGVFHAFKGDSLQASQITSNGFYIGVGGPLTYKNSITKRELFSKISLSMVVLETDSPFLTPQLHRGKRNEPAYIRLIAQQLAELQQVSIEEIAESTTRNARNLFSWKD